MRSTRLRMPVPAQLHPLEFRNVPQLMAEDDYLELVATALPGTAVAARRGFIALALARLCGATSWASLAESLDLVVSRSESTAGG